MVSEVHLSKCGPDHEFQLTRPSESPVWNAQNKGFIQRSWMFSSSKIMKARSPDGNAAPLGEESVEMDSKDP